MNMNMKRCAVGLLAVAMTAVAGIATAATTIDLAADATASTPGVWNSNIEYLLTDPFTYDPASPTATVPNGLGYLDGAIVSFNDGRDAVFCYTLSNAYTTVSDSPVIALDVWGRNENMDRDDDFDVLFCNGNYDTIVGRVDGLAVTDDAANPYVRANLNTLPEGTTFDRIKILGHLSITNDTINKFALTEIRLAAVEGELAPVYAAISTSTNFGSFPLEVTFDGSASISTNSMVSYLWDLGDGTATNGSIVTHTYTEAGEYSARLNVVDSEGITNSTMAFIEVVYPVQAVMNVSTNSGAAPLAVDFDGAASTPSEDIVAYLWDLGDGTTTNVSAFSHTYTEVGQHTATLSVVNTESVTNSTTVSINVINPLAPVINVSTNSGSMPLEVIFDASASSSTNGIAEYNWDFGDGKTASGVMATNTYETMGQYTATLTLVGNAGYSNDTSVSISVFDAAFNFIISPTLRDGGFESGSQAASNWTGGEKATFHSDARSGSYAVSLGGAGTNCYQNSEHIVTGADEFTLEIHSKSGWNWQSGSDKIIVSLFATDNDLIDGVKTEIGSFEATAISGAYATYLGTFSVADLDPASKGAVIGQQLFVQFSAVTTAGYARVDDVTLTVAEAELTMGEITSGLSGTNIVMSWEGSALASTYTIETRETLVYGDWEDLVVIPGSNGVMTITLPTTNLNAFYRVSGQE